MTKEEDALDLIFYDGQPVFQNLCHIKEILESAFTWQKDRVKASKILDPKKIYGDSIDCTGKRLVKDEVTVYNRLKRIRKLVSNLITTMENQC